MRLGQAHSGLAVGFEDEAWWSRVAQPQLRTWAEAHTSLRLQELEPAQDDRDTKALVCYGLLVRRPTARERMLLRFVAGRPVSAVTIDFRKWSCQSLGSRHFKVLALVWAGNTFSNIVA